MMTFLHITSELPKISTKLFWMKVNRFLAWTLIFSVPLQWAVGISFWTGLLIDLVILVVHGAMSLALFGAPRNKEGGFSFSMHVTGFRDSLMSERHRFLLTGYRIAQGALAIMSGFVFFPASLMLFYPLLRLPITLVQHIFVAMVYAFRRWGAERSAADGYAAMAVCAYFVVAWINVLRHFNGN